MYEATYWPQDSLGRDSADPYVRAIIRGRAITSALARLLANADRGAYWVDMRRVLSGEGVDNWGGREGRRTPAEQLRHVWGTHLPNYAKDHPYGA